jgi:hypothetical protein
LPHFKKDHVIQHYARDVDGADQEDVGRPDRRKHTRARHTEARLAESSQHFRREPRRNLLEAHEFFLLPLHWAWVLLTLPHASAIVSNTRSCWNDGFT